MSARCGIKANSINVCWKASQISKLKNAFPGKRSYVKTTSIFISLITNGGGHFIQVQSLRTQNEDHATRQSVRKR